MLNVLPRDIRGLIFQLISSKDKGTLTAANSEFRDLVVADGFDDVDNLLLIFHRYGDRDSAFILSKIDQHVNTHRMNALIPGQTRGTSTALHIGRNVAKMSFGNALQPHEDDNHNAPNARAREIETQFNAFARLDAGRKYLLGDHEDLKVFGLERLSQWVNSKISLPPQMFSLLSKTPFRYFDALDNTGGFTDGEPGLQVHRNSFCFPAIHPRLMSHGLIWGVSEPLSPFIAARFACFELPDELKFLQGGDGDTESVIITLGCKSAWSPSLGSELSWWISGYREGSTINRIPLSSPIGTLAHLELICSLVFNKFSDP